MALVRKPCPRKRFPCSRCGAKIVNAGLQWEISVPKYRQWFYMNPVTLATQPAASASPIIVLAPRRLPFVDPETSADAPCKFDGPPIGEGFQIIDDDTPASGGQFVQDFEWQRFTVDGWNFFSRTHEVLVSWEPATVEPESGDAITPGRWKISLTIHQSAVYHYGTTGSGEPIFVNVAPGGVYLVDVGPLDDPDQAALDSSWLIQADYYPPADYACLSAASTRWTRAVPTLPVIQNTPYTFATLPAGYQWPDDVDPGLESEGPFYPVGFVQNNNAYFAPPYIDVRHTPK